MPSSLHIEQNRRRRVIRQLLTELASCDSDDAAYERKLDLLGRRIAHRPSAAAAVPQAAHPSRSGAGTWQRFWRSQRARFGHIGRALPRLFRKAPVPRQASRLEHQAAEHGGAHGKDSSDARISGTGPRAGRVIGSFGYGATDEGATLRHMLYEPAFRASGQAPLLVMLHGCNQNAAEFAAGTRMNEVAEDSGIVVLYPEQSAAAHALRCWNWYALQDPSNSTGDAALIARLTCRVMRDQDIDPARVYVAGMSAGGAMATVLARDYSGLFAALGVHSGVSAGCAHDALSAMRVMSAGPAQQADDMPWPGEIGATTLPCIVFHDDADTIVHPSNADALYIEARSAGERAEGGEPEGDGKNDGGSRSETTAPVDGQYGFTRSAEFAPSGVTRRERWVDHGAAHAWTGGDGTQPHTDAHGPEASRQMMRFFLQHHRNSNSS